MPQRVLRPSVDDENGARGVSAREREVLGWFARGKSAEDVAAILGLAPATVMFHYRRVADHYGTLNRTHTVVEALRRGDLIFDDDEAV